MQNLRRKLKILPKEVSDYTTPVIQSTITKSLENVVLAKYSSQPKSTYEAVLDKDLFESYGKAYSLKRDHEDKDKDEDPPAGSRILNHQKALNLKNQSQAHPKAPSLSQNHLEYPFDLKKPLPLIEDRGCQVVPVNYFINNDLEYLKGGSLSRKYTTSTTKTKAAKYNDIQGIEDMHDVFSTKRIIAVTHVKVMKWYDYRYLDEIVVRREDQKLYKFKEGDFQRLNLRDIEYMLLLLVQKKIANLKKDFIFDFNVALRMIGISKRTPYTAYNNPQGIIYVDKFKRNRLMRSDELYKFSDGTLTSVRSVLHDIASNLRMDYLPKRRWSNLEK
ncbi:hypothetical protein Tco_1299618 [Tanacetum coccineum]